MSVRSPTFTFGIEEEYHLVDLDSRDLAAAPTALMDACKATLGKRVMPEFLRSQIEVATGVNNDFRRARAELASLRRTVADAARTYGIAPVAAATHPFAHTGDVETTPAERYRGIERDLAGVSRNMSYCGMHVHVAIEDQELRIDLMNQVRYFLPHLLMLSTSSPFWQGENTGLKSYRLAVNHGIPRSGIPGYFENNDEYTRTIDVLVRNGVIEDASKVWWDVRPSAAHPTLELRIPDVVPRLDDAITIAALYVSIVRMLYRLRRANLSWRNYPILLLEENRWRAQRYGVDGSLFDFGRGELVPFRYLIEELIDLVAEDADALGCVAEVERARRIAADGTSANRQVSLFDARLKAGRDRDAALREVVDTLAAETSAD